MFHARSPVALPTLGRACLGLSLALVACEARSSDVSTKDPSAPDDDPSTTDSGGDTSYTSAGVNIPLGSLDAFSYTMDLTLGGQPFSVIIDTGSTTTAVASADCTDCRRVSPVYTPGASATDQEHTASSWYEDGSGWSGEVYEDNAELPELPMVTLDFAAIDDQNQFFVGSGYQGIVGLGPSELLVRGTTSYMDLLADAGVAYEMAFRLCAEEGDMWIGGYDPEAAAAAPRFTPMVRIDRKRNPYYSVEVADMAFGGTSLGFTADDFGATIVDTGTSLSYVPTATEDAMLAAINGNAAFQALFPGQTLEDSDSGGCVTGEGLTADLLDASLPTLSVAFPTADGGTFSVELPASRSYLEDEGSWHGEEWFCWAFGSSGARADYSLFGDTLMAGMLTVFDVAHERIGFAPEAGCDADSAEARSHGRRSSPGTVRPVPGEPWYASNPHFRPPPSIIRSPR